MKKLRSEMKVHLINTHGIGDIVMTLPLIDILIQLNVKLTITVKSEVEAEVIRVLLLRDNTCQVQFNYFNEFKNKGFKGYFLLIKKLRSSHFCISLPTHGASQIKYNLLAWCSGSKYRVGLGGRFSYLNHKNFNKYSLLHKALRNVEIANATLDLGVDYDDISIPSYTFEELSAKNLRQKYMITPLLKWVAIGPGSGEVESHKRWPINSYTLLAERLLLSGYGVILLGGPGEEYLGRKIASEVSHEYLVDLTGKITISQTLDVLSMCTTLVANCNGLSHLGSTIINLKIVGIYGPTSPKLTGPFRDDLIAVKHSLLCSPCYRRGFIKGCGDPICMKKVSVETVFNAVINE